MENNKINPFTLKKPDDSIGNSRSARLGISGKIKEIDENFITIEDPRGEIEIDVKSIGKVSVKPGSCKISLTRAYKLKNGDELAKIRLGDVYSFVVTCSIVLEKSMIDRSKDCPEVAYGIKYMKKAEPREVTEDPIDPSEITLR